jgi:hypothetical protein
MEMNNVNPRTLRKFNHPKPVDTDERGTQVRTESVCVLEHLSLRSRGDTNIDRSSGMRNMVTPMGSRTVRSQVGGPQGTYNTPQRERDAPRSEGRQPKGEGKS